MSKTGFVCALAMAAMGLFEASPAATAGGSAAGPEMVMTFQLDRTVQLGTKAGPAETGPATQPTTRRDSGETTVTLGPDYVIVQEQQRRSIFDFKGKRIYQVNLTDQTYSNDSLYFLAGFRGAEYQNCIMLGKMLREATKEKSKATDLFEKFDLEAAFACPVEAEKVEGLAAAALPRGQEWKYRGETVTRYAASPAAVPKGLRKTFSLWLVYQHPIHPVIRRAIEADGHLPQTLFVKNDHFQMTETLELKSQRVGLAKGWSLEKAWRPAKGEDARLAKVIAAAESGKPGTKEQAAAFSRQAVKEGAPLDAMLCLTEYGLQADEMLGQEMRSVRDAANNDPPCSVFVSAMSYRNKSQAEAALKKLDQLDASKLKKKYVLDIFRGDILQTLRQPEKAKDKFLNVLENNPYIGGVYKDLGGAYFQTYRMDEAWRCWDEGRKLYPHHSMLEDITKFEEHLEKTRPDHFLPSGQPATMASEGR